jgi:putative transposase
MPNYRRVKIEGGTYFFTLVTNQRQRLFSQGKARNIFLESVSHGREIHPFSTIAYCILPDHIHLLWELPIEDANYSLRISEIKKRFSKHFIAEFGNSNHVTPSQLRRGETGIWQRRFWEHYIRDEADLFSHIDYIHCNPLKHNLVDQVKDWSASSFFDFVKEGYYDIDWGFDIAKRLDTKIFGE